VNFVFDTTLYCPCAFGGVNEHVVPFGPAVTSTHGPLVELSVAEPDLTRHVTPFDVPFVTVAKMRRSELGITLKPNPGWAIEIPTGPATTSVGLLDASGCTTNIAAKNIANTFTTISFVR
jgi:hypothetical protein